jgi:nucleoside-diphosphate-sugar epimerase
VGRVLVTGATGFVGRCTIPLLVERGFEVHAVHHAAAPPDTDGVRWHRADLLEPGTAETLVEAVGPTHLLHLAWYAAPGRFWASLENVRWVEASLRLLRAFGGMGRRAVIAGTCAEYDWRHGFCSEMVTPLEPESLYGVSKLAVGRVAMALARETGMSLASGRIFFLYGPGERPGRLVSSVTEALIEKRPAPCSHGHQFRDFLHVADVASAFIALLESEVEGPVNIASGEAVTIRSLLIELASWLDAVELLHFGEVATGPAEPPLLVGDVRRLRDEVGWTPSFTLSEGLADTIEWWRARASGQSGAPRDEVDTVTAAREIDGADEGVER